jgi:hypothetical protein
VFLNVKSREKIVTTLDTATPAPADMGLNLDDKV